MLNTEDYSNTICAPCTASGGAIGVIRISGPEAISIANSIFSKDISETPANSVVYGEIIASDSGDTTQKSFILDDVVITVFRAPRSYTGEDTVEISHHGSPYIQKAILSRLMEKGCLMAQPGEYTKRAFLNGKMDLTQAEAVADLIASDSAASHNIAMSHMRGGIKNKLEDLRSQLVHLTSLLELELDFSDHEDLEFADRSQLLSLANIIASEIERLLGSFDMGNAIKNGIPVAIIGAPNVGKSTLLNQLLGDDRAIVSDIQGTTRDIIEDTITIDGVLFRFIDTAGIRHTDDTIESLGIERSIKAAEKSSVIIMMTEPGVPYPDVKPRSNQHIIRVVNKTDDFQAMTGKGMQWLKSELHKYSSSMNESDVIITNLRHKECFERAHHDILRSIEALNLNLSGDLIAEDLRQCIYNLSQILGGEISTDEILGNIFKHFCIGK